MPIVKLALTMTLFALGCGASDGRIEMAEHAITHCEQRLERVAQSYDSSEQDIARMRIAVDALVQRARLATYHLEMAARDYEYAALHHTLVSAEFTRAAESYEIAAAEYEQIASLIITAATSKRLLANLCKRSTNRTGFDELLNVYGANLDGKDLDQFLSQIQGRQDAGILMLDGKPLNLPLPALKALAKRAAQLLLCDR